MSVSQSLKDVHLANGRYGYIRLTFCLSMFDVISWGCVLGILSIYAFYTHNFIKYQKQFDYTV